MTALAIGTHRLTDPELIEAVTRKAALAEAEIEAAFRFQDGSSARDWHLERADQATVELLGLINGPQYRAAWERFAALSAPMDMRKPFLTAIGGEALT